MVGLWNCNINADSQETILRVLSDQFSAFNLKIILHNTYSDFLHLSDNFLIEKDHLGDWSPEKDCC